MWNTLRFRISLLPLFNPLSRFPMSSRRNTVIRTVAALCGDIAVGVALATACAWIIEAAALGLFLSFLLWLIGTVLALALSQYLVHPAVQLVLSDRKLDGAIDALGVLAEAAQGAGAQVGDRLMRYTRQSWQAMAGRVRPT
jgi:ABC-type sugar transport system permease subunit